jgi:hypothetical protein
LLVAQGFWLKLLDALVGAGAVTKSTAIDSTYVKAQRAAFGGDRRKRSAARVMVGRLCYDKNRYRAPHLIEKRLLPHRGLQPRATYHDKLAPTSSQPWHSPPHNF